MDEIKNLPELYERQQDLDLSEVNWIIKRKFMTKEEILRIYLQEPEIKDEE